MHGGHTSVHSMFNYPLGCHPHTVCLHLTESRQYVMDMVMDMVMVYSNVINHKTFTSIRYNLHFSSPLSSLQYTQHRQRSGSVSDQSTSHIGLQEICLHQPHEDILCQPEYAASASTIVLG